MFLFNFKKKSYLETALNSNKLFSSHLVFLELVLEILSCGSMASFPYPTEKVSTYQTLQLSPALRFLPPPCYIQQKM